MSILHRVKNMKPAGQSNEIALNKGLIPHPERTTTNSPRKDESFEAAYLRVFDVANSSQNLAPKDVLKDFAGGVQNPTIGKAPAAAVSSPIRTPVPAPAPVVKPAPAPPPAPRPAPAAIEPPERAQDFDSHNDIRRGRPGRRSAVPGAVRDRKLTANLSNMEYLAIIQAAEERGITTSALIRAALFEGYGIPRPHPELVPTIAQSRGRGKKRKSPE